MKQRRRIFPRFGLRSILVLTTIVAVICGGWLRQAHLQRGACAQLSSPKIESIQIKNVVCSWALLMEKIVDVRLTSQPLDEKKRREIEKNSEDVWNHSHSPLAISSIFLLRAFEQANRIFSTD